VVNIFCTDFRIYAVWSRHLPQPEIFKLVRSLVEGFL